MKDMRYAGSCKFAPLCIEKQRMHRILIFIQVVIPHINEQVIKLFIEHWDNSAF